MLNKELYLFYWIPVINTVLATVGFTAATFHARMYTMTVMKAYLINAVRYGGIFLALEGLVFVVLGKITISKVEGKGKRE